MCAQHGILVGPRNSTRLVGCRLRIELDAAALVVRLEGLPFELFALGAQFLSPLLGLGYQRLGRGKRLCLCGDLGFPEPIELGLELDDVGPQLVDISLDFGVGLAQRVPLLLRLLAELGGLASSLFGLLVEVGYSLLGRRDHVLGLLFGTGGDYRRICLRLLQCLFRRAL